MLKGSDGLNTLRILPPDGEVDRTWLADLWVREWGGTTMVSRGQLHQLADLEALLAWEGAERVGENGIPLQDELELAKRL